MSAVLTQNTQKYKRKINIHFACSNITIETDKSRPVIGQLILIDFVIQKTVGLKCLVSIRS